MKRIFYYKNKNKRKGSEGREVIILLCKSMCKRERGSEGREVIRLSEEKRNCREGWRGGKWCKLLRMI